MAKSTKDKPKRTVARFKGAVKYEQRRVKIHVVRLIENLPIEQETGKLKCGAIKAIMVVQQQLHPWFTRHILDRARVTYKEM
jgi:hypothetical protein